MADEFAFPLRPADLERAECDLPLKCGADLTDVAALDGDEADEFCERECVGGEWRGGRGETRRARVRARALGPLFSHARRHAGLAGASDAWSTCPKREAQSRRCHEHNRSALWRARWRRASPKTTLTCLSPPPRRPL